MKSLISLVAVTTVVAGISTIARADMSVDVRTETVQFADLDTSNADGAAVLYHRIKNAAARVCRSLDQGGSLALKAPYTNCVHMALSNAVTEVDRPAVTAYAAARGITRSEDSGKIARAN